MLDDDKIGPVDQWRNSQLYQTGPTTLTHTYSPNAIYQESWNLDVEVTPRDYWNNEIKMIININCRIVLGLVQSL